MIVAALVLLAATGAEDPRIPLVELQLQGNAEGALQRLEITLESDPEGAQRLGLEYLRGHLLESLGRQAEAHRAFAQAMGTLPDLREYSRYRLALTETRMGHPEVAAGLLARLLGGNPPRPLVGPATDLLVRLLDAGGDCALLDDVDSRRLPAAERRKLELARADCDRRRGDLEGAAERLLGLLRSTLDDETARGAAERLDALYAERAEQQENALLVGRAFHRHRQFELAVRYLRIGLGERKPTEPLASDDEREALYELARSHFWQADYLLAASRFGQLAAQHADERERARPLFHQGRSYELNGNWDLAANSYRRAFSLDPEGDWAGAALLAALRVEWRTASETSALELYELLGTERRWLRHFSRAALFLAASDLVRGRADRASGWLDDAELWRGVSGVEVGFWRGRLAELTGRPEDAVRHYLEGMVRAPFDPVSRQGAARLERASLTDSAVAVGRRLAGSRQPLNLYGAWLLLGGDDPVGLQARHELDRRLRADPRARPFLEIDTPPPAEWPLWRSPLRQPEEMLLALGVWSQGSSVVLKHFPVNDTALGFTGSWLLAQASENRRSLYIAEILGRRIPESLPEALLPLELRRLLFPLPFRDLITGEAGRAGADPYLLAAVIREESRFDSGAVSAASARGLTQFVLPTARRLAGRIGIERLQADDLHDPSISIALGAAYLAELGERFEGEKHTMVAAYNAGERQAQLWRSYCYSREPAEFLTKVGFPETRRYLTKVLSSRAQYEEIYSE